MNCSNTDTPTPNDPLISSFYSGSLITMWIQQHGARSISNHRSELKGLCAVFHQGLSFLTHTGTAHRNLKIVIDKF